MRTLGGMSKNTIYSLLHVAIATCHLHEPFLAAIYIIMGLLHLGPPKPKGPSVKSGEADWETTGHVGNNVGNNGPHQ